METAHVPYPNHEYVTYTGTVVAETDGSVTVESYEGLMRTLRRVPLHYFHKSSRVPLLGERVAIKVRKEETLYEACVENQE